MFHDLYISLANNPCSSLKQTSCRFFLSYIPRWVNRHFPIASYVHLVLARLSCCSSFTDIQLRTRAEYFVNGRCFWSWRWTLLRKENRFDIALAKDSSDAIGCTLNAWKEHRAVGRWNSARYVVRILID